MGLKKLMLLKYWRAPGRSGTAIALALAALAVAACGSPAEPTREAPAATAAQATVPAATGSPEDPSSTAANDAEPQGDLAAKFTLPSAQGDSVSLESFAGDRNVVLVFYRGFW